MAEPGGDGTPSATDAATLGMPPQGGAVGSAPFTDTTSANDFWGVKVDPQTLAVTVGELAAPTAGSGGGGGGDTIHSGVIPPPLWYPALDEKGAGGGGGGGQLQLLALGEIRLGPAGRIAADGGDGVEGENASFADIVAAGSGGGSGGHLILMAASFDLSQASPGAITAAGGRGGPGPLSAAGGDLAAGGDGGPGIVQLHAADPAADLALPPGTSLAELSDPDAHVLRPSYGRYSAARSDWIGLGGAPLAPPAQGGGVDPVAFTFGGTDPATGAVLDLDGDGTVDALPPLLGPAPLAAAPTPPFVERDGRTLVMDAAPLAGTPGDVYLRNPALLRELGLVLVPAGGPAQTFDVAAAGYEPGTRRLRLTVAADGPELTPFAGGPATAALVPRFFRVRAAGVPDQVPPGTAIEIRFQATGATPSGAPDGQNPLTGWTADAAQLGVPGVAYYRFEVRFDLDTAGLGLGAANALPGLPELDFLRLPFRF